MKPTEQQIREAMRDLWYCHPVWASTFSACECGRGHARGGRMCSVCAEERLAHLVGREIADAYHRAVIEVRRLEREMFDNAE